MRENDKKQTYIPHPPASKKTSQMFLSRTKRRTRTRKIYEQRTSKITVQIEVDEKFPTDDNNELNFSKYWNTDQNGYTAMVFKRGGFFRVIKMTEDGSGEGGWRGKWITIQGKRDQHAMSIETNNNYHFVLCIRIFNHKTVPLWGNFSD